MRSVHRIGMLLAMLLMCLFLISGCGSNAGLDTGDDDAQDDSATTILVADIGIVADEYSVNPGSSTAIYATVYSASGATVPGVTVEFSLDKPTLASITSKAVTSANGTATAIFSARSLSGEVNVYAAIGGVSNSFPASIIIVDQTSPVSMDLTANPSSVIVEGSSTVTAMVWADSGKNQVVPNGTSVVFEVANEFYGTITSSATTNSGKATATFTASENTGFATIKATSGMVSKSTTIEVLPASVVAISFVSAQPDVIALEGSGGNEISTIKFIVKDSNDDPVPDVNVSFTLHGPNGDEYIDDSDSTPDTIDVSTDADGIASVRLHSGSVTGPVTISASIEVATGKTMTAESSVVSIGGGVPSAKRFSLGADQLNVAGLEWNNLTSTITAYLADRFGNYNVLDGTSVSFICEMGGAIDTSEVTVDDLGMASVIFRTQGWGVEVVEPESWEIDLKDYVASTYGYETTGYPRNGLCAVMAYTRGEEHFDDLNANGLYDAGDIFTSEYDTLPDPFVDYNDDGLYTTTGDPVENRIDSLDGDTKNNVWDGDTYIFRNLNLLLTDTPVIFFDTNTFSVPDGGGVSIKVLVCDYNLNPLTPGTKVVISAEKGKMTGATENTFYDTNCVGYDQNIANTEFRVSLFDDEPGDTELPESSQIIVTVDWEGHTYKKSISGTVD